MNFINSIANNSNFAFFLRIFDEFFSGFRAKFQKIVTCAAFSIKFAKTNQKFAENSEFCEKNSLLLVNYSLHSLTPTQAATERHFAQRPLGPADRAYQAGLLERVRCCCIARDRMQTLQGSFSAVSKPNFARKYAFESSRRDLHNALLCTALAL